MMTLEANPIDEEAGSPEKTVAPVPEVVAFGMRYSNINFDELCDIILERRSANLSTVIFTPNVDHVVRVNKSDEFRDVYEGVTLSVVDGTPLMWALRLLGRPVAEKLSGSDLVPGLSAWAAGEGLSVFLLGAAPGVADAAAEALRASSPTLKIAGTYCPPLGFEHDPDENEKILQAIRAAKPDLLFAALGSPKQEIWLADYGHRIGPCTSIGIGATLDFLAGRVRRAPRWMQQSGIEWLWRLVQEPRRLWRRYLVEDSAFIAMFLRAWCAQRLTKHSE